jgi:hypothetical protein
MAKKKTAGSDTPDAAPVARRRTTKRGTPTTASEAPVEIVETSVSSTEAPIAQANDTGNGSGAPHLAETTNPTYEQIAEAAYQRFLRRGAEHGRDYEDWLEAERELRSNQ